LVHQNRESKKYDNPIPSREYILEHVAKQAVTTYDLYDLLEVKGKQKKPLTHRLRAMVRDKQLSCNREGEYSILLKGLDCRISLILCFGAGRS
jgi:ribonuclease R